MADIEKSGNNVRMTLSSEALEGLRQLAAREAMQVEPKVPNVDAPVGTRLSDTTPATPPGRPDVAPPTFLYN